MTRALIPIALVALLSLAACGTTPASNPPGSPAALLADAQRAVSAPTIGALQTACAQMATDMTAAGTQSGAFAAALSELQQAQASCQSLVSTTPAGTKQPLAQPAQGSSSQAVSTVSTSAELAKNFLDAINSAITLLKQIPHSHQAPANPVAPSPAPVPQPSTQQQTPTGPTNSANAIVVHIDDQSIASDGRSIGPAEGHVQLNYHSQTYSCGDGQPCGAGAFQYSGGTVTLIATWEPGSKFDGWKGGQCGSSPSCTFTPSGDTELTAAFLPATYVLSIVNPQLDEGAVEGDPSTGIECGLTAQRCQRTERAEFPLQLDVVGSVTPDYDVSSVSSPCVLESALPAPSVWCQLLSPDHDITITVAFEPAPHG